MIIHPECRLIRMTIVFFAVFFLQLVSAQDEGNQPSSTNIRQWTEKDWEAFGKSVAEDPEVKKMSERERAIHVADRVGAKLDEAGIVPNVSIGGRIRSGVQHGQVDVGSCSDLAIKLGSALTGAGIDNGKVVVNQSGLRSWNPLNVNSDHGATFVVIDGERYVMDLWLHGGDRRGWVSAGSFSDFAGSGFDWIRKDDWKSLMEEMGYDLSTTEVFYEDLSALQAREEAQRRAEEVARKLGLDPEGKTLMELNNIIREKAREMGIDPEGEMNIHQIIQEIEARSADEEGVADEKPESEADAPKWALRIDSTQGTASSENPAVFRVAILNRDDKVLSFNLSTGVQPSAEAALWARRSNASRQFEIPPGGRAVFSFALAPRNKDAKSLTVVVRVSSQEGGDERSVSFSATAEHEEEEELPEIAEPEETKAPEKPAAPPPRPSEPKTMRVTVSSNNQRALANGRQNMSAEMKPGDTISLRFTTWGTRREFCTSEVIERNRNMRSVSVHSHGPNGCSWGTHDGRMHAAWKVDSEEISWSGTGVRAGRPSTTATFTVPSRPGNYTVTARGRANWSYVRQAPGGTKRDSETESSNAVFTIRVE